MVETKLEHYFFVAFAAATNPRLALALSCPGCKRRVGKSDPGDHIGCNKPPTRKDIRDNISTIIALVDREAVLRGYYEELKDDGAGSTMFGYELYVESCPFVRMSTDREWRRLLIEYILGSVGMVGDNKIHKESILGGYDLEVVQNRRRP